MWRYTVHINKVIWKAGQVAMLLVRRTFYRLGTFVYGYKLGTRCRFFGKIRLGSCGRGIVIGNRCMFSADIFLAVSDGAELRLGDGVSVNTGGHIVACKSIVIGDGTAIGEYVSIRDQNHRFDKRGSPIAAQGYSIAPVKIGRDAWIGRGCFIGPGVEIGDGAVIGANSVVLNDIPPDVIAVGAPAKPVRNLREKGDR
jgi:acetyltransferase-like isoleucine patch superfamily enzyme